MDPVDDLESTCMAKIIVVRLRDDTAPAWSYIPRQLG